jgi:hypothetical protein
MDYIFWDHDRMSEENSGTDNANKQLKQKTRKMAKQPPKGFDTRMYTKAANKAASTYRKNSKEVPLSGIQAKDQRSSMDYSTRVPKSSHKPMSVTYGATKNNKGTTVYKVGKKK